MKRTILITVTFLMLASYSFSQVLYAPNPVGTSSNSNVGIGTSSPSYTLDVAGILRGTTTANIDLSAMGSASTVYFRTKEYNRTDYFYNVPWGSPAYYPASVSDVGNGATIDYVAKYQTGWCCYCAINRNTGFTEGYYDIYIRIRTDGGTSSAYFGVYDQTAATDVIATTLLSGLSTAYKEVYGGRMYITAAMLGQTNPYSTSVMSWMSNSGTDNYYIDYIKFVPSPLFVGGNVGIGTTNPFAKLEVKTLLDTSAAIIVRNHTGNTDSIHFRVSGNGYVIARDIQVKTGVIIPDYVFEKDYDLKSLSEVEKYIKDNKHLPDVPSATDVKNNGLNVAGMDATLLKKIEEQTLYIIDLQKQIIEIQKQNETMQKEIDLLKKK